ncbi:MAG: tripartite tricarboxylate transporter TctB family protein [Hydrogenophaga sp.]|nr:tripartite tricarboxylate transporter TctB family protein [Hydrogenophaga sp.]
MIKNRRDFWAGWLFVVLGVAYAWAASLHDIGWTTETTEMGPGFFPLVLAALLSLLGASLVFKSLTLEADGGGPLGPMAWGPLLLVLAVLGALGAWAWWTP